ncbi:hypothetical protein [Prauserella halophila]|uniref:hypothetical protein n=1 Tax=Prauserella halophila TaxID=185641 RepID=UPI0027E32604|nr:hypothetical protein [Prauserella halophila]
MGGLERGERNPTLRAVERIAEHLDMEPLDLLIEDDAAPPRTSSEERVRTALAVEDRDVTDDRDRWQSR